MKTSKSLNMSLLKTGLFLLFIALVNTANASTQMKVYLTTGGDDLRGGGNTAHITVNYADGTTSPEYTLGGGFANNSLNVKSIELPKDVTDLSQIRSIMLRHNGSPRAGQPFDTYDNWDLSRLRVTFMMDSKEFDYVNQSGNPLVRFTGQLRNRIFAAAQTGGGGGGGQNSTVKVFLTTGSDDLRGGNNAYMTISYTDGTTSPEIPLGGGFGQNSLNTKPILLNKVVGDVTDIKSISLRHDGSPRAGQPFDTYDNWDLQVLRVALVMPNGAEQNVVNERGNPLTRFTGALRTRAWNR
jgi:hypothetical protein